MSSRLAVRGTGLVTSVGLTAAASCAAIRAKVSSASETHFIGSGEEPIRGHVVALEHPWTGVAKLVEMAALSIEDCLRDTAHGDRLHLPLLLCLSERARPGRWEGLDEEVFDKVQRRLGIEFSPHSLVIPQGRASVGVALSRARKLFLEEAVPLVLIAATDSLLNWPTLFRYQQEDRLLSAENSNGFIPGEGASAVLMGAASGSRSLIIRGVGLAKEPATIDSEQPLRGDGLAAAIRNALSDANCVPKDLDFRIADLSGEQYYFKEAALAHSRALRARKEEFDIWHPAECIGETGAVSGVATLVVAEAACRKAYAPGPGILCHASNDGGQRAAAVLRYEAV
jgi:3-oxoacyl-[acyl-carrier-protein] synthase I